MARSRVIYDPLTTVKNPDGTYTARRSPATSSPPTGSIPIGAAIAAFYKAPTTTPGFYGQPDYAGAATLHDGFANEATGKVDHQFTNWWRANFAYMHYGSREVGPDWWGSAAAVNGAAWELKRYADSTTTNQTFTPNPTTVISVRYGYNRFPNDSTFVGSDFNAASLGFPASFIDATQGTGLPDHHHAGPDVSGNSRRQLFGSEFQELLLQRGQVRRQTQSEGRLPIPPDQLDV